MTAHSVHIVALAARTALGRTAETSAAAVRAGISRVQEHPFLVDVAGEALRGAYDRGLDPELPCSERLVALAEHGLAQLRPRLHAPEALSLPLLLALPETRPGFGVGDVAGIERGLARGDGALGVHSVRTVGRGHAGALEALDLAAQLVSTSAEGACIVGGVDSWFEPRTLAWLTSHGQLRCASTRSAFFPGEGACFVVVAREEVRRSRGWPSLAVVRGRGVATERAPIKTDRDNLGVGLADAVAQACRGLGRAGELVDDIYCDINGERYRAEEWGLTALRTSQWLRDPSVYVAPAGQWGDLGAATGAALTVLAVAAWARGYARGPVALLVAGSESGRRGAVLLARGSGPLR
jgi:3-oxoacyl-[acyl-carrier-protein] synthase I